MSCGISAVPNRSPIGAARSRNAVAAGAPPAALPAAALERTAAEALVPPASTAAALAAPAAKTDRRLIFRLPNGRNISLRCEIFDPEYASNRNVEILDTPVNGQFAAYPFKSDGARYDISGYTPQTGQREGIETFGASSKVPAVPAQMEHGDTTAARRRPTNTAAALSDRGPAVARDRRSSRQRGFEGRPVNPLRRGLPVRLTRRFRNCGPGANAVS
jgi:hypothetical protein